jgi:hypothetical protein
MLSLLTGPFHLNFLTKILYEFLNSPMLTHLDLTTLILFGEE